MCTHNNQSINEEDLIKSLQSKTPISINLGDTILDFNLHTQEQLGNKTTYYGNAKGYTPSIIAINFDSKKASGEITINKLDKTWIVTSDQLGNLIFTEEDAINHSCVHEEAPLERPSTPSKAITTPQVPNGVNVSLLESRPGSDYVIYIDTDGEVLSGDWWNSYYNNGLDINAQSPNLSDNDIYEIWQIMSEDYLPFDVNITTRRDIYDAAHYTKSIMIILTNTSDWQSVSTTGVGRFWSFAENNSPCWAFPKGFNGWGNNQMLAEVCSHEVGHTLGLNHDGNSSSGYYAGHGNWAPIMGAGYYNPVTQFSKGEYSNANNREDDLAIMTGRGGLNYKTDDHGNSISNATPLADNNSGNISITNNHGVIEQSSDADFFSFYTGGGIINLAFTGASPKPNLKIKATLYNDSSQEILSNNVSGQTNASLNTTLTAGNYYIKIEGVGDGNPLNTGYSDYGSLGYYGISGSIENFNTTDTKPVVSFTDPTDGSTIQMNPFQPVTLKALATDSDGTISSVKFTVDGQDISASLQNGHYVANWTPNAYKSYTISVTATDNDGKTDSESISVTIELPPTQNNMAIISTNNIDATTCGEIISPTITIKNIGQQNLTAYTLKIFIDGALDKTINKTSSLATGQTSNVNLGDINLLTDGSHSIKIVASSPNNVSDENTTDNESLSNTDVTIGDSHEFFIADRSLNPSLSWEIKKSNTTVASSSNLTATVSQGNSIQEFCLASGCYDITVTNAFSSGTCSASPWSSSVQYCSEEVSYKGKLYKAKWCGTGNPPDELNYQWEDLGACTVTHDTDVYGLREKGKTEYFTQDLATYSSPMTHNFCNGTPLSLGTTQTTNTIKIYPNPVSNIIHIDGEDVISSELINNVGVIQKTSEQSQIETSDLTPGLYILKVKTKQGVQSFHIIKE